MIINRRHEEFSLLYSAAPPQAGDAILVFRGGEVLLKTAEEGRIPAWEAVEATAFTDTLRHAFTQGGIRYFITGAAPDAPAPDGHVWEDIRVFRTLRPETEALLLSAARHLLLWYETHRFCCACGGPVRPHPVERALVCETCGFTAYPAVLPAIIVAVTDGDRLLLARNAHNVFRFFSLIAGFVEVGETAEQTVRREVLEEVGLRVKNIHYIKSQPWGISQSLMLGFTAELDGPDEIRLQESELAEARWFPRDEVPQYGNTASIAFDVMERFRRGEL